VALLHRPLVPHTIGELLLTGINKIIFNVQQTMLNENTRGVKRLQNDEKKVLHAFTIDPLQKYRGGH
jgi:hypothetical protein